MPARRNHPLTQLAARIVRCRKCPELRSYCAEVARAKRKSFQDWEYWGRPVPGFGDGRAKIMIIGLAPAAHGANRTGRMFTGDRSGDFLYAALHRAGLASQPASTHRDDGLRLRGVYISAAVRCAPPANKPTPGQRQRCLSYLVSEIELIQPRVLLCLGAIGWNAALEALREGGHEIPRPRPKFAHGAETIIDGIRMLGCYHVSQQNTFTGRLTEGMVDGIIGRAIQLAR